jgi:dTDP-4-dehydrorhamnose 3,5-epimerase
MPNFHRTELDGAWIIDPDVYKDERGYFFQSWSKIEYELCGVTNKWIQDNESKSTYGVLRGLHYQIAPYTQAKLVRCVKGHVYDVIVDIRKDSSTFGKWIGVDLTEDNKRQLFVPKGFAHGFVVLSDEAIFQYKVDEKWNRNSERGIRFDDPFLNIDWRIPKEDMILSEKDKVHPLFSEAEYL